MRGSTVKMLRRNAGQVTPAQWRGMKRNWNRLPRHEREELAAANIDREAARKLRQAIEAG